MLLIILQCPIIAGIQELVQQNILNSQKTTCHLEISLQSHCRTRKVKASGTQEEVLAKNLSEQRADVSCGNQDNSQGSPKVERLNFLGSKTHKKMFSYIFSGSSHRVDNTRIKICFKKKTEVPDCCYVLYGEFFLAVQKCAGTTFPIMLCKRLTTRYFQFLIKRLKLLRLGNFGCIHKSKKSHFSKKL